MDQAKVKRGLPWLLVIVITIAYAWFFSWYDIARHNHLNSSRFDLGNVEQVVWNFAHGHGLTMTDPYGTTNVSRFAFHADPFLAFLAIPYAVFPRTETLLLLQVLFVASGIIAAYLIGRKVIGPAWAGAIIAGVYALNPGLQWATMFDVHAITFAAPLILWAVASAIYKKYWLVAIFTGLALITKEQVGLSLAVMGLWLWLSQKKKKWGIGLALVGIIYSLTMFLVVLPKNSVHGSDSLVYKSNFGTSAGAIIGDALSGPVEVVKTIFAKDNLHYYYQLISGTGWLPLLSPLTLGAVPDLAINVLSTKPAQHLLISHYTAGIVPWLIIGLAFGWAWSAKKLQKRWPGGKVHYVLGAWILAWLGLNSWLSGPLPLEPHDQSKFATWRNTYATPVKYWAANIPATASVSVTNNIGAQFARRNNLYSFPLGIEQSDYVVVLENHATPVVASDAEVSTAIAAYRDDIVHWEILAQQKDLTVLKRK